MIKLLACLCIVIGRPIGSLEVSTMKSDTFEKDSISAKPDTTSSNILESQTTSATGNLSASKASKATIKTKILKRQTLLGMEINRDNICEPKLDDRRYIIHIENGLLLEKKDKPLNIKHNRFTSDSAEGSGNEYNYSELHKPDLQNQQDTREPKTTKENAHDENLQQKAGGEETEDIVQLKKRSIEDNKYIEQLQTNENNEGSYILIDLDDKENDKLQNVIKNYNKFIEYAELQKYDIYTLQNYVIENFACPSEDFQNILFEIIKIRWWERKKQSSIDKKDIIRAEKKINKLQKRLKQKIIQYNENYTKRESNLIENKSDTLLNNEEVAGGDNKLTEKVTSNPLVERTHSKNKNKLRKSKITNKIRADPYSYYSGSKTTEITENQPQKPPSYALDDFSTNAANVSWKNSAYSFLIGMMGVFGVTYMQQNVQMIN